MFPGFDDRLMLPSQGTSLLKNKPLHLTEKSSRKAKQIETDATFITTLIITPWMKSNFSYLLGKKNEISRFNSCTVDVHRTSSQIYS